MVLLGAALIDGTLGTVLHRRCLPGYDPKSGSLRIVSLDQLLSSENGIIMMYYDRETKSEFS
jgi:hypothetical protein